MKKPLILDCTASLADCAALRFVLQSGSLSLLGVTTVTGVTTAAEGAGLLSRLLGRADAHLPLAAGAAAPLARRMHEKKAPSPALSPDGPAEVRCPILPKAAHLLMAELLEQSLRPVTILATGPLTNIALLLASRPDLKERIDHITAVGGAVIGGNATPAAEYNFYTDPEAADYVLKSGIPVILHPLDLAAQTALTREEIERTLLTGTDADPALAACIEAAFEAAPRWLPGCYTAPLAAVVYENQSEIFETVPVWLAVETASEYCDGHLICDRRGRDGHERIHRLVTGLDREVCLSLLAQAANRTRRRELYV
ncbi:MAG: nucleoside hydrolase [Clostridia bacterium]|nr:nucleoside hydrolase [Clostridia bacterium]